MSWRRVVIVVSFKLSSRSNNFRINLPRSANAMACEDSEAGISSLHVRGRGRPKFHDTKDASRSLLVWNQVHGTRGTSARHGASVCDLQCSGPRFRHVRKWKRTSTSHAEISTTPKQTAADDILGQEVLLRLAECIRRRFIYYRFIFNQVNDRKNAEVSKNLVRYRSENNFGWTIKIII